MKLCMLLGFKQNNRNFENQNDTAAEASATTNQHKSWGLHCDSEFCLPITALVRLQLLKHTIIGVFDKLQWKGIMITY